MSKYFEEIKTGLEEIIENAKFLKEFNSITQEEVDEIERLNSNDLTTYESDTFLNSNQRNNGKTYYYCMVSKYHGIPVLVHDLRYKKDLMRKYGKDINVMTPHEYEKYYHPNMKIIVDTTLAYSKIKYSTYVNFYSDDEIRDIILTDLSRGVGYE